VDDVADDKQPVEKAVELFVYAPVGMACYFRDMLPSMMGIFVARGKREVSSHRAPPAPSPPPVPPEMKRRIDESVGVAKYMAEGGLGVARDVAGSGIGVAREVAGSALAQFLAMRANGASTAAEESAPAEPTPESAPESAPEPTPEPTPEPPAPAAPAAPAASGSADATDDVPSAETLPIPDYDELSASQVVERLEGLDRESLESIRRYESEHRGRNTILGKIAQLS
jgi:hypothetical protein